MTADRKDIERDQVWLTREGKKATVISIVAIAATVACWLLAVTLPRLFV